MAINNRSGCLTRNCHPQSSRLKPLFHLTETWADSSAQRRRSVALIVEATAGCQHQVNADALRLRVNVRLHPFCSDSVNHSGVGRRRHQGLSSVAVSGFRLARIDSRSARSLAPAMSRPHLSGMTVRVWAGGEDDGNTSPLPFLDRASGMSRTQIGT
jgi:hypothetical protein